MKINRLFLLTVAVVTTYASMYAPEDQSTYNQRELIENLKWIRGVAPYGPDKPAYWLAHHPLHPEWAKLLDRTIKALAEREGIWNDALDEEKGCMGTVLRAKMGTSMANKTNPSQFPHTSAIYNWIMNREYKTNALAFAELIKGIREEYPAFIDDIAACMIPRLAQHVK